LIIFLDIAFPMQSVVLSETVDHLIPRVGIEIFATSRRRIQCQRFRQIFPQIAGRVNRLHPMNRKIGLHVDGEESSQEGVSIPKLAKSYWYRASWSPI
jgi:hypothetical protein